jgi:hypothetical protein
MSVKMKTLREQAEDLIGFYECGQWDLRDLVVGAAAAALEAAKADMTLMPAGDGSATFVVFEDTLDSLLLSLEEDDGK